MFPFFLCLTAGSAPRAARISGKSGWVKSTGERVLLTGPNVVLKGAPWLPRVAGNTVCNDTASKTCTTFNEADAEHILKMGWNSIRLGVPWPGAQPTDADQLDASFVNNLHAILGVCEKHAIHVVLDMHTDMVGSANCGWGLPMWLSKAAAPELIGKPLTTGLPYSLISSLDLKETSCGSNETAWAEHAGDPNYNLLNSCCISLNAGSNNQRLGYTELAQKTMHYLLHAGAGRDAFVRYWALLAAAVADYPHVIGMELMNEPMSIARAAYFETWHAANDAIVAVVPDMSVAVMDLGENAVFPAWLEIIGSIDIHENEEEWLRKSNNLFYSWHWYGDPAKPADAVKNVLAIQDKWNISSMLTETMNCAALKAAEAAGISWSYWHYSQYCDTAAAFGGKKPPDNFGACILGWGGGNPSKTCE